MELGFLFADGILARILNIKNNNIFKIQIVGKTEISYAIRQGNIFSHGATLKQARDSFIYKINNRDTSAYENMTLDTILTKKEAITMYMVITGACEFGTKHFIETILKTDKNKAKIAEIIEITKGQYNNNLLVEFFNK